MVISTKVQSITQTKARVHIYTKTLLIVLCACLKVHLLIDSLIIFALFTFVSPRLDPIVQSTALGADERK